tara:strand:+ start:306 stop:995 length:690 start_codon:yes stop_codon:yes gene_type:complete
MKLILENWRKYITEGMMTVDDLPDDTYVAIKQRRDQISIFFANESGESGSTVRHLIPDAWKKRPYGQVDIRSSFSNVDGNCAGAWIVAGTEADEGWGPLLYDVAIEWATQNAQGLAPDRSAVSAAATKVWDYYLNNRNDVESSQLDDLENTLTPDEDDNCLQNRAKGTKHTSGGPFSQLGIGKKPRKIPGTDDWEASSLSKKYTKPPTTLNQLQKMGRLLDYTTGGQSE